MLRPALAACLLPTLGLAQIDPPEFEHLDALRVTSLPFGASQTLRYLEVHDGLAGPSRTVAAIAFRRHVDDASVAPAFTATMSMRLSTAATTAATIDAAFAANHGGDESLVLPQRIVSFPATQPPLEGLAPFEFEIPADFPFAFGGTGPLCFELVVASHQNQAPLEFALAEEDPELRTASLFSGCGGFELATSFEDDLAVHELTGSTAGSTVFLAFGTSIESFAGVPLPYDLTPLGGIACDLSIDILVSVSAISGYDLATTFTVDTAGLPLGTQYFCQGISPQILVEEPPPARTLLSSNVAFVTRGTARVAGRVWSTDPNATAGIRQPIWGLVVEAR